MNILLDDDNEWDVNGGNLNLVEGPDEISQIVTQRLKLFFGEWFLDTGRGVRYFEDILKKRVNGQKIDAELINEMSVAPGVINIKEFNSTFDSAKRTLSIQAKLDTIEGEINFNEVLP